MPQRTIASATEALDGLPGLTEAERREFNAELTRATAKAQHIAEQMATERVNEVAEVREEALAELCSVRDGYADLIKQADLGRITAAEYEKALNELRGRQRAGERHLTRIDEALAFVESVEADPLAYADSLYSKYPLTQPTFSF
jgi:uncharacterized coiled-coil DUF342 family protein